MHLSAMLYIPMFAASSSGHASAPQVHRNQLLDMLTTDNYLSKEPNCHEQTPAMCLSIDSLAINGLHSRMSCSKENPSQDSLISEKSAKRPTKSKLFTTEEDEDRTLPADEDVLNIYILPRSLLQSVSPFTFSVYILIPD